jgi:AraC-like DNA-binding protein
VRHAFDTLVRLAANHDRHTARATALQLELLVLVIERASQPGTPSERRALATFERIRQHLDTHFLRLRTLEDAAAACHVDVSYLCRLFRRFHGEKPFRYLQRLQMQWAAERLHTSGRLIREVADELSTTRFNSPAPSNASTASPRRRFSTPAAEGGHPTAPTGRAGRIRSR